MTIGETSPTGRALQTLDLLQRLPGVTADRLAAQLGVTERAARRYVAILREAGIPVDATRGPYGGYRLGRGMRPAPLVFTAAETLGLVMAVLDGQHAAADPEDPVGAALGKLIGALPDRVARPAAVLREHALTAPTRRSRPDPDIVARLVTAVAERRSIRLGYRTASGSALHIEADPWAVVVRFGRWYLLGRAHLPDEVRTLRIDRIESLENADATFDPPADLDPVALLERHLGSSWAHPTRVVFDAPYADVAPWIAAPMGTLTPLEDGARCELRGSTNNPAMYAGERLAAIPYPFRVMGGAELTAAVADLANRLAAAVNRADSEGTARRPPRARSAAAMAPPTPTPRRR